MGRLMNAIVTGAAAAAVVVFVAVAAPATTATATQLTMDRGNRWLDLI